MPAKKKLPFSQGIFRRDIYFLAALLLANKEIMKHENIKDIAKFHARGEINRLLILSATSARLIMDSMKTNRKQISNFSKKHCGTQKVDSPEVNEEVSLEFYAACNSILHALKIGDCVEKDGQITISISGTKYLSGTEGDANVYTELDTMRFVGYCTMLSEEF